MYPFNNNPSGYNNPYPYPTNNNAPYPGQPNTMPTPDFGLNYQNNSGYPPQGGFAPQMPGYPSNNPPYGGPEYSQPFNYTQSGNQPYQPYEQNEQYNRLYGQGSANQMDPYPPQMPPYNQSSSASGYNPYPPSNNPIPAYNPTPTPYQPTAYPNTSNITEPNLRPSGYPDLSQYSNQTNQPVIPVAPTYEPQKHQFEGTVKPYSPFNPIDDAEKLYKAMKGIGTNETVLIDILCKRTAQQRMQIASAYKTCFGKDLIDNVKNETSGNFHDLLKSMLMRPEEFAAYEIHKAIAGVGTDEKALIDVICSKSNAEMAEVKNAYKRMFGKNMEHSVKDDVSGYFKRLLISLMNADRLDIPVDVNRAREQARELKSAGVGRLGTDEVKFNRIFAAESFDQLRCIFDEYYKLTGHDIEQAIRREMSGDVMNAFLALAKIAKYPPRYFAERIGKSMIGLGTHEHTLIRNIILRCEIDMREIKVEFQKIYSKTLESFIKGDCSGDFKKALLCLVGDSHWK